MLGVLYALDENYEKSLSYLKQALSTFRKLPRIDYEPLGMDKIIYAADIMELVRHVSHHDYEIAYGIEIDKIFVLSESKQKSLEKIDFLGASTTLSFPSLTSNSSSPSQEKCISSCQQIEKEILVKIEGKEHKYIKLFSFKPDNFSFDNLCFKLERAGIICPNESIAYKDLVGDYVSITDEEDLRIAYKKLFTANATKLNFRIISK